MAPDGQTNAATPLSMPIQVVGPADVKRLLREISDVEDFLHQSSLRKAGEASRQIPQVSRLLNEFAESNQLNLLQAKDRRTTTEFLKTIKLTAPSIHISFATDPSPLFIGKLVMWMRANIHPQLLVEIGLQPAIAAGCVVRTKNHYFDFSLRQRFDAQHQLLIDKLGLTRE